MSLLKNCLIVSLVASVSTPVFANLDAAEFISAEQLMVQDLKSQGLQVPSVLYELLDAQLSIEPLVVDESGRSSGDTILDATPIGGLPFVSTGNTAGYENNYDEPTPWSSNSPDLVFEYTPQTNENVNIQLCNSNYDTRVFVYDNSVNLDVVASDDDGCPGTTFRSRISDLSLTAGVSYYIVVDGYGGESGKFEIEIDRCDTPCEVDCAGAIDEGEGYYPGQDPPVYNDSYNGGCNYDPAPFSVINCGDEICGTVFNYYHADENSDYRDLDWYEFILTEETTVVFDLFTCSPNDLWIIIADNCGDLNLLENAVGTGSLQTSATLQAGSYMFIVTTYSWDGLPETEYNIHMSGDNCGATAAAVEVPVAFELAQNYPNPFNPTTSINFSIENTNLVNLSVHRINGEKVATLIDGMVESGNHSIDFDASSLSSGVYFYTLNVNGMSTSNKMILMK
jgi:hypothetical protein